MRPSLLSAVALTIVALYATPAIAQDTTQNTAQVEFQDQTMDDDMVVVASVTLPQGGFVTIHDDRLLDGDAAGSVVGTSMYLNAGTHTDVEVTVDLSMMDDGMDNTTDDTNNDTGGTSDDMVTLIAMPHMDTNNNQVYDFVTSSGADDGPYTQSGGGAVTAQAQVTKDDGVGDDDDDDGLDDPGDDGFPDDGEDDDAEDEEDNGTPGFEAVALLALLGAVAVFRRR